VLKTIFVKIFEFLTYSSVNLTQCDYVIWIFCVKLIFNVSSVKIT